MSNSNDFKEALEKVEQAFLLVLLPLVLTGLAILAYALLVIE